MDLSIFSLCFTEVHIVWGSIDALEKGNSSLPSPSDDNQYGLFGGKVEDFPCSFLVAVLIPLKVSSDHIYAFNPCKKDFRDLLSPYAGGQK